MSIIIINMIIEDGYNSSYIDTLLFTLFNKEHDIDHCNIIDMKFYYLYELINYNFIFNIKKKYTIDSSLINEIRNAMIICGWHHENVLGLHPVHELFDFLMNGFNRAKIMNDLNYIELKIYSSCVINDILNDWVRTQIDFAFDYIPNILPIYLNRQNVCEVDINFGINLYDFVKTDKQKYILWNIDSIICYTGSKYYAIILTNGVWYLYENSSIEQNDIKNAINEINMKDEDFVKKIKKESIFVIYVKDNDI